MSVLCSRSPRARKHARSTGAVGPTRAPFHLIVGQEDNKMRAVGDQAGHPGHESREGDDPPRPALPGSASAGVHARGRQGEEDATLRGSPAGVRSGGPSEARPSRPAASGMDGSENPHHVGDGGSRRRAAARYGSAASLHGAECLTLTDWT